jgi:RNA polymerase sigma factor (sigma-70 family)
MLEDRLLLWKLKGGSREALRRIYEKYENDLLTLAANLLGDSSAAEDVLQDVFIRFVESVHKFELKGSLKAYLAKCVANRCRDCIRKRRRQETIAVNKAEQTVSNPNEPAQLAILSEELNRASKALRKVPCEQREAVVLRLHGNMRFRQIAKLQDVSVKTALSRYRYGLNKLRSILNGEVEK